MPLALLGASKLGPLAAGFGTRGCFLPAFNPDVWPPSNPSRRGKVATGSARGLKTWLFTVSGRLWHNGLCFNACHSGRLAALKPSPAGYGCHWLQALAQWAVFYRLSIRTFGRPQTLPGGVRLPLALLGASKLGFSPFPAGSGTMGCVLTAFTPDVWPPSNPSRRGKVATGSARGLKTWLFTVSGRLWHNGLCFNACHSGRLAALKPSPAGYGCHWLRALAQWAVFYRLSIRTFGRPQTLPGGVRLPLALLGASKLGFSPFPAGSGTMGCVLTAFNPDVWPPSNPSRRGKVATGSARGLKTWLFTVSGRLWHNGLCFNACHSGRLAALKPSPAGYGCHWLQALAQWAVFYRLSIRTFGRPQTLPGGVRLPLALLGASKLGFSPFPAGSGTMGCVLTAFNPDVWPPSNPSRRGKVATGSARGLKTWLFTVSGRLWHNGLCFNACHSGRLAALKPSPAGYVCHWLQALAQWAVFAGFQSGRLAALKRFPAGYGCHWLC